LCAGRGCVSSGLVPRCECASVSGAEGWCLLLNKERWLSWHRESVSAEKMRCLLSLSTLSCSTPVPGGVASSCDMIVHKTGGCLGLSSSRWCACRQGTQVLRRPNMPALWFT
jgi:hypothetical protein